MLGAGPAASGGDTTAYRQIDSAGLGDRVTVQRLDIRDMSLLPDQSFDLVPAEGDPVGYCGDVHAAIRELARVARRGAHVMVSVDSRMGALGDLNRLDFASAERMLARGETAWNDENEAFRFPVHAFTLAELGTLFTENGLRVVRSLGKPVFFSRLKPEVRAAILADEALLRRLVDLECRFADDPGWAGSGGHVEVTGVKVGGAG